MLGWACVSLSEDAFQGWVYRVWVDGVLGLPPLPARELLGTRVATASTGMAVLASLELMY